MLKGWSGTRLWSRVSVDTMNVDMCPLPLVSFHPMFSELQSWQRGLGGYCSVGQSLQLWTISLRSLTASQNGLLKSSGTGIIFGNGYLLCVRPFRRHDMRLRSFRQAACVWSAGRAAALRLARRLEWNVYSSSAAEMGARHSPALAAPRRANARRGRLAQLVRALASHARGQWFKSTTAHHQASNLHAV